MAWLFSGIQATYADGDAYVQGTTLYVEGDDLGNDITISVDSGEFVVEIDDEDPRTFGTTGIDRLVVYAAGGNDFVDTQISDTDGTDLDFVDVYGQGGSDTIYGSLLSGFQVDYLDGGDLDDSILGNTGDDFINGGDGNDTIWGGNGDDTLNGNAGRDCIMGDAGDDVLTGGSSNDSIAGGSGADTIDGDDGTGTDLLYHAHVATGNGSDGETDVITSDVNDSIWANVTPDSDVF